MMMGDRVKWKHEEGIIRGLHIKVDGIYMGHYVEFPNQDFRHMDPGTLTTIDTPRLGERVSVPAYGGREGYVRDINVDGHLVTFDVEGGANISGRYHPNALKRIIVNLGDCVTVDGKEGVVTDIANGQYKVLFRDQSTGDYCSPIKRPNPKIGDRVIYHGPKLDFLNKEGVVISVGHMFTVKIHGSDCVADPNNLEVIAPLAEGDTVIYYGAWCSRSGKTGTVTGVGNGDYTVVIDNDKLTLPNANLTRVKKAEPMAKRDGPAEGSLFQVGDEVHCDYSFDLKYSSGVIAEVSDGTVLVRMEDQKKFWLPTNYVRKKQYPEVIQKNPFQIGDEVRSSEFEGRVVEVADYMTLIRTIEGTQVWLDNRWLTKRKPMALEIKQKEVDDAFWQGIAIITEMKDYSNLKLVHRPGKGLIGIEVDIESGPEGGSGRFWEVMRQIMDIYRSCVLTQVKFVETIHRQSRRVSLFVEGRVGP